MSVTKQRIIEQCFRCVRMLLFALAVSPGLAFAQTETGQILGKVTDPSGALVPNASIAVKSIDTGREVTVTSNEEGNYTVTNLQPGLYEVTVQSQGFAPATQRVQITVGSKTSVETALAVTAMTGETINVVAGAGIEVNTQHQELSDVVSGTQIRELPTVTRNPYDLVKLSGNAVSDDPSTSQSELAGTATYRGTGVSINGQRAASTNILLDGADNNNTFSALIGQNVPLDSVQEFRVISSNFSAEYGRASGGIVNVATRSGSNEFNGTAYAFNRLSRLASNGFDSNARNLRRGVFTRNQFGYSIGGPILKNKLFFFNSSEFIRVRSSGPATALVPAAGLIAAADSATRQFLGGYSLAATPTGRVLTVGQVLTEANFPAGNAFAALPVNTPAFQEVQFSLPQDLGGGVPQNSVQSVSRVDWNVSDNTLVYGRYAIEKRDLFPGTNAYSPYQGFNTGLLYFNQNALISVTHTFSQNLVSQSKIAYNRVLNDQPLGEQPAGPTLYVLPNSAASVAGTNIAFPGYLPFNPGSAIPSGGPENKYQLYQDFNYVAGRHQFRVGGQYFYIQQNHNFGAFQNAVEVLGDSLVTGLDNLVRGQLTQFSAAIDPQGRFPGQTVLTPVGAPSFTRYNRYHEFAAYFNDAWRVVPRVTLNLGLRYEYYGVQRNNDPRLDSNFYFGSGATIQERIRNGSVQIAPDSSAGGLWKPDLNNFAPRLGFAADLTGDGRTSLRGGYGVSYERNFGNVTFNVIQNPPNYAVINLTAGTDVPTIPITLDNAGPLAGGGTMIRLPGSSLRHVREDIRNSYAHFYSLALEREVAPSTVASLEFTGSAGEKLYSLENINRPGAGLAYLGSLATTPTGGTSSRLNGQYTSINTRGNGGFSNYNALVASLASNDFRRTGLQFTARYTYSVTKDNLSSTFSDSNANSSLGLTDPFDPELDYGYADFDARHRFVGSFTYEVPYFDRLNGFAKHLLGGISLTGIVNARTGLPFTAFDCSVGGGICARIVPAGPVTFDGSSNPAADGTNPNSFNYLQLPAIVDRSGTGANGPFPAEMVKRNAFRGPGYYNIDAGLYKRIRLNEKYSVQLRFEAFNLLNHANLFINPLQLDGSSFNFIAAQRGVFPSGNFERRNVQLAAKFIF